LSRPTDSPWRAARGPSRGRRGPSTICGALCRRSLADFAESQVDASPSVPTRATFASRARRARNATRPSPPSRYRYVSSLSGAGCTKVSGAVEPARQRDSGYQPGYVKSTLESWNKVLPTRSSPNACCSRATSVLPPSRELMARRPRAHGNGMAGYPRGAAPVGAALILAAAALVAGAVGQPRPLPYPPTSRTGRRDPIEEERSPAGSNRASSTPFSRLPPDEGARRRLPPVPDRARDRGGSVASRAGRSTRRSPSRLGTRHLTGQPHNQSIFGKAGGCRPVGRRAAVRIEQGLL